MAQVPSYVPTNGLIGWWPFNGNANDESGNGNNGKVTGATLTKDRFGDTNRAYSFDGFTNYIETNPNYSTEQFSLGFWIKPGQYRTYNGQIGGVALSTLINGPGWPNNWEFQFAYLSNISGFGNGFNGSYPLDLPQNYWAYVVCVFDSASSTIKVYKNGYQLPVAPFIYNKTSNRTIFGGRANTPVNAFYEGSLDDIGIWNRALTQQEITELYNATKCTNNATITTITPQTNSLTTGVTATFTAATSDPNPSYVWQSDLGQGFQTLKNFGNYSGVNTATLNIANVQLSEHNQSIRVIQISGNCFDTSNVAVINILDTCITNLTVYDTLLTTVTDTLIINATITGINPQNNLNTLKVFPNPASTHITIDYGNFNAMSGYTLKIFNAVGQIVFTTLINQQTSYIDLSTWTGSGIYFVQLIDPQNNTIENRKIVIQ
jgi:hypothetical protein